MSAPPVPPGGGPPTGPPRPRPGMAGSTSHLIARARTQGYAGYALAWSPFFPGRLAVAGAANYGLVGNGKVHLLSSSGPQPGLNVEKSSNLKPSEFSSFDTQDGLYSVAWSEIHENQLATASGDGSIKMWDVTLNDHPIRNYAEHSREVFSLNWNNIKKELFASGSWDGSAKIWHPERPQSLLSMTSHTGCVYGVSWSPHSPDLLATACGDGHLRLFDLRTHSSQLNGSGQGASPHQLANQPRPVASLPVGGEVLSLDWNKYRPMTLATGSTDRTIKVWDLRSSVQAPPGSGLVTGQGGQMVSALLGHEYAVRSVAWSPHNPSTLASASYDMTARIWDTDSAVHGATGSAAMGGNQSLRKIHDGHTEFVAAVAWSLFEPDRIASCAWDAETHLW